MSTRCQVLIRSTGLSWDDKVMLYHHCDGYPSNIVPLLQDARIKAGDKWESGRVGKVAGIICSVDPGQFEPESGLDLHGDIEYLYILTLVNKEGGSMAEGTIWNLEVYIPKKGWWELERPTSANMYLLWEGGISSANGQDIEDMERGE